MGRRTKYVEVEVEVPGLDEYSDAEIAREAKDRDIELPRTPAPASKDEIEQAEYEFDTWMHDLRAAFLSRDQQYFDVLLTRAEHRYRDALPEALMRGTV